jgi:D-beta-D-heptose 7-phosphate kinase/D-beta-D-heptose 1-phosphate adenosyltransferase
MTAASFDDRALGHLPAFAKCRLLVVGDIMLDEYVWGSVRRISPEAPVPVVAVRDDSRVLGGAANVAVNIAGLSAKSHLAGLVGNDHAGKDILGLLRRRGIGVSAVVSEAGRPTTRKTRVIAHNQQIVRVDREKKDPPAEKAAQTLLEKISALVPEVDGVILSDYRKGVLTRPLVAEVVSLARKHGAFVAVDPKHADFGFYAGCTIITPNKSEAEAATGGQELSGDLAVAAAGRSLLRKAKAAAVLITRGEEGMTLVERGRSASFHVPALARQVFDVTGAGDTVIATLAVAMAAGIPVRDAALLANVAAGVVVGEVGTAPITIDKLRHALRQRLRDQAIATEEVNETVRGGLS